MNEHDGVCTQHRFFVNYLHLVTHTALGDTVTGSCSGPQVSEAFDGQWISAVPIPGHFEVQITVV